MPLPVIPTPQAVVCCVLETGITHHIEKNAVAQPTRGSRAQAAVVHPVPLYAAARQQQAKKFNGTREGEPKYKIEGY